MIYIWFGLDGTGIQRSSEFHEFLGPGVMIAFAFLGNTLFLTILVSMLSNTFSSISSNAVAEMQFRRAVITLEGVKADAVFAYQPPFNILAVFLFLPLKFVVSPRWFHKIHVATVKSINFPVLLIIAIAERRLLWGSHRMRETSTKAAFWRNWHFSASHSIRSVFEVPPPDDVAEDIAADDDMTRHLIRRQFTRQTTSDFKPPSRRDSMFPGIRKRLRGSFTETEDYESLTSRLDDMEKTMARLEVMLVRLMPPGEDGLDEEGSDDMGGSSTLRDGDGLTADSSFKGSTQNS